MSASLIGASSVRYRRALDRDALSPRRGPPGHPRSWHCRPAVHHHQRPLCGTQGSWWLTPS